VNRRTSGLRYWLPVVLRRRRPLAQDDDGTNGVSDLCRYQAGIERIAVDLPVGPFDGVTNLRDDCSTFIAQLHRAVTFVPTISIGLADWILLTIARHPKAAVHDAKLPDPVAPSCARQSVPVLGNYAKLALRSAAARLLALPVIPLGRMPVQGRRGSLW